MIRKYVGIFALLISAAALLSLGSCARDQKLVGITVQPANATFGGVGAQIQFRAIGSYIHPPENKDVTQLATWAIDSQNLVTIDAPGLVTDVSDCGTGNVTASIQQSGNFFSGSAFVSAVGVGTTACTQASLTVIVAGTGTVTSSPAGITCPGTCSAPFPLDSSAVLTGAPAAPATTVTFTSPQGTTGCNQGTTATTCSLALDTNQTITATFQ
ncbi:MAG TPA: hypothetical protein VHW45_13130 [Candidatus Sulfotelmatobacter sp.]|jgi:hypothetical protein|nr:hypothetical protein [Candidatus Sulfotelmatobacter sp.]